LVARDEFSVVAAKGDGRKTAVGLRQAMTTPWAEDRELPALDVEASE
jgi:hypothetical protein